MVLWHCVMTKRAEILVLQYASVLTRDVSVKTCGIDARNPE